MSRLNASLTKRSFTLLVLLLLLAAFLRFYKISSVPSSLYYDEVDLSYQARSLIETQKDYRGRQSLFYALTFNDPKAPLPIILSIPATVVFNNEELQVRATPVILGVVVTLFAFLLVQLLTKNFYAALLTGVVFATNPWQIQFSRWAVEGIFSVAFYIASLYLFLRALEKERFLYLIFSVILFSLTVYTYRTMSLFVPLTFVTLFLIYRKELWKFGLQKLVICAIVAAGIIMPFLYNTTITAPDVPRIAQVSIFSNKLTPILIQRDRELDSNDFASPEIGKSADKLSYLFHNKPLSYANIFYRNYLQTFSADFLFLTGAANDREAVGEIGELFYIDIFAFIAGCWFVLKNIKNKQNDLLGKHYLLFFILLVLAPIPASLTYDGAKHGSRLFIFSLPLLLTLGLGWWQLLKLIKDIKYSKFIYLFLAFTWFLCFIFFYHRYIVEYPIRSAASFGYGFKQAALEVGKLSSRYQNVYLSATNDPPIIYYLFWEHISPKELQSYGSKFDLKTNFGKPLDKYKVVDLHVENKEDQSLLAKRLEKNILYVFTGKDLPLQIHDKEKAPEGVRILDIIKYPNNESAFYLVDKI